MVFTSDDEWDPSVLDVIQDSEGLKNSQADLSDLSLTPTPDEHHFDSQGLYSQRVIAQVATLVPSIPTDVHSVHAHTVKPSPPDPTYLESLRRCLGWTPIDIVKQTLAATTQYAKEVIRTGGMRQHLRSRFPALNV